MAVVTIPDQGRTLTDVGEIQSFLSGIGLTYERWQSGHGVPAHAPAEEILSAYAAEIEVLKQQGGYVTADVIDIHPETPGLDDMLSQFNREHIHDEDEVRFIIEGSGLFHIRPDTGPVAAIEVIAGDLLGVPRSTRHWFHLCPERRIRAIRMFQDPAGWTPHYTGSGMDALYQPVCLGRTAFPPGTPVET